MEYREPRLTIGYTYYEDPTLLKEQLFLWKRYPPEVEIIVVDDGSVNYPAFDVLKNVRMPANLRLYSVHDDLGFNSHGCRNLIAKVAYSDYVLFCDIDCQFSPQDIAYLRTIQFQKESLYNFHSYTCSTGQYKKEGHINVFLVNTETFWEAGGYDESFTGYHYGDREFIKRLKKVTTNRKINIACMIVRGKRKIIVDNNISKSIYDNLNHTLTVKPKNRKYDEMVGTVTTKINFSYTELL